MPSFCAAFIVFSMSLFIPGSVMAQNDGVASKAGGFGLGRLALTD
jgi:hypothetical protein